MYTRAMRRLGIAVAAVVALAVVGLAALLWTTSEPSGGYLR